MDNIIELLVFLFVIYSILAPLFGKKKQKKTTRQIPTDYSGDVRNKKTSPDISTTDILEDFLGFKIPKTEDHFPVPQSSQTKDDLELTRKNYERDLEIKYSNLEAETKNFDTLYDKDKFIELSKPQITSKAILEYYEKERNLLIRANEIKNKLTVADTLKDYILISEILNKPKALRR